MPIGSLAGRGHTASRNAQHRETLRGDYAGPLAVSVALRKYANLFGNSLYPPPEYDMIPIRRVPACGVFPRIGRESLLVTAVAKRSKARHRAPPQCGIARVAALHW